MSLGWLIEIGQIQQTVTCVADTTVTVICHSVTVLWCDSLTDNCHSRVCRIYARQSIPSNVSVTWHNFDQSTAHVMRQIKTDFMLYFSRTFNRLKRHLSLHAWMRRGGLATRVPIFIIVSQIFTLRRRPSRGYCPIDGIREAVCTEARRLTVSR